MSGHLKADSRGYDEGVLDGGDRGRGVAGCGAGLFSALLDVNMMALGGIERTERHWRELLGSVGLEAVEVKMGVSGRDGLIRAMLAD